MMHEVEDDNLCETDHLMLNLADQYLYFMK